LPPRKQPRKLTADELFEWAVKSLAVRAASIGDLSTRMRRKALLASDVATTIERLKEIGYLNDQRYAESFASARVENDGFGRRRLLTDLRARRVEGKMAEHAVEQALAGKSEEDQIEAWIERRMPRVAAGQNLGTDRELAAAYRRLLRAGFAPGPVLRALKRRAANPEVLDETVADEEETPEE
jgi:regulatory protein